MGREDTLELPDDVLGELIQDDKMRPIAQRAVGDLERQKRQLVLRRWQEMEAIYTSWWMATHQLICRFIWPNRSEFWQYEANRGDQRDEVIFDNTATIAGRKCSTAIEIGCTSEASEWFSLSSDNPEDDDAPGVAEYCHLVQTILFSLMSKSGWHKANRNVLDDLVGPAIGLMLLEPDAAALVRCTHVPIGQYRVSSDKYGNVNRVLRRFTYTASQMVEEFGWERCSPEVQQASKNENVQTPFQVIQLVEPRIARDTSKKDAKNKPWASYWLEIGAGVWGSAAVPGIGELSTTAMGPQGLLRESGYDIQPFVCPRWNTIGTDPYGKDSSGWTCLSDVMALQGLTLSNAKAIGLIVEPPLAVPSALKNANLLPGAITYLEASARGDEKVQPFVTIPTETITVTQEEKKEHRERINAANYGDVLFLISNGGQQTEPATAEEIRGKKAEQLLQLGGVFSRISDEYLKPSIAAFLYFAQAAGMLPPPPPQLAAHGKLKLTFQNPLVTAQKTLGFAALQQILSTAQATAEAKEAGVDQIDFDQMLREAAEALGVNPRILVDAAVLEQQRAQRAQAQQAQTSAAALTAGAPAVKALSDSNPDRLQELLQRFGGAASAQAGAGATA